jgi:hypothetical protein
MALLASPDVGVRRAALLETVQLLFLLFRYWTFDAERWAFAFPVAAGVSPAISSLACSTEAGWSRASIFSTA